MLKNKLSRQLSASISILMMLAAVESASAAGLMAPISFDSTGVLPKGIRNLRVGGFTSEVTDKYDGAGHVVPLANAFNKPVTWNMLVNSRSDLAEQAQLRGGLESQGVNLDEAIGVSAGIVNLRLTSTVPVFAYGLTDNVTLGLGLPVVYTNSAVDAGWMANSSFNTALVRLQQAGFETRILKFATDLQNVVTSQIRQNGYKELIGESRTDIGDLTVGLKERIYKSDNASVALSQRLVLPTGRTADIDKVVDPAPGDGHFNLGVGAIAEVIPLPSYAKFSMTSSATYLYQFASNQAIRVPRSGETSLSPDKDNNVQVKRGDIATAGLAGKYQLSESLAGQLGYSLQYKMSDSFQGGAYAPSRYAFLERDTWSNLQAVLVSFSGSTIPLFKKKQFPVPLDASFSVAHVLGGANASKMDIAIFDLAAYF